MHSSAPMRINMGQFANILHLQLVIGLIAVDICVCGWIDALLAARYAGRGRAF